MLPLAFLPRIIRRGMKSPQIFAIVSDEYGPFTMEEESVRHQCAAGEELCVFDLMMLLQECPGDARVTVSTGDEAGINVSWKDGYFSIPASNTDSAVPRIMKG
jgi:hypothetical protein